MLRQFSFFSPFETPIGFPATQSALSLISFVHVCIFFCSSFNARSNEWAFVRLFKCLPDAQIAFSPAPRSVARVHAPRPLIFRCRLLVRSLCNNNCAPAAKELISAHFAGRVVTQSAEWPSLWGTCNGAFFIHTPSAFLIQTGPFLGRSFSEARCEDAPLALFSLTKGSHRSHIMTEKANLFLGWKETRSAISHRCTRKHFRFDFLCAYRLWPPFSPCSSAF